MFKYTIKQALPKVTKFNAAKFFLVLLVAIGLSSCDSAQPGSESQSGAANSDNNSVQLQAISFQQWNQRLEEYRDDIVVVDLWATWCAPCIKRFPKMVELDQEYRDQGIQFVAINLDDHQDREILKKAEEFLIELNATFDNYYMDENIIDAFEKLDILGIPAVVIYDGEGNERYRLTGDNPNKQFTDADIETAIQELLAEQQDA